MSEHYMIKKLEKGQTKVKIKEIKRTFQKSVKPELLRTNHHVLLDES